MVPDFEELSSRADPRFVDRGEERGEVTIVEERFVAEDELFWALALGLLGEPASLPSSPRSGFLLFRAAALKALSAGSAAAVRRPQRHQARLRRTAAPRSSNRYAWMPGPVARGAVVVVVAILARCVLYQGINSSP